MKTMSTYAWPSLDRQLSLTISATFLALLLTAPNLGAQAYSENVVGYVDVSLTAGWRLVSRPLDNGDNGISNLFTNVSEGSLLVLWDRAGQHFGTTNTFSGSAGWQPGSGSLGPGEGAFLWVSSPTVVSVAGELWPRTCLNFSGGTTVSSILPLLSCGLCGQFTDPCPLTPPQGTQVLKYNSGSQSYDEPFMFVSDVGWFPNAPSLEPGEAAIVVAPSSFSAASSDGGGGRPVVTQLVNPSLSNATFRFQFGVPPGVSYRVKRNDTAAATGWVTVARATSIPVSGLVTFTDEAPSNRARFYKVEPLRLINPARDAAQSKFQFQFPAESGSEYRISRRASTASGTWESVDITLPSPAGGLITVIDSNAIGATGYYRVQEIQRQ